MQQQHRYINKDTETFVVKKQPQSVKSWLLTGLFLGFSAGLILGQMVHLN